MENDRQEDQQENRLKIPMQHVQENARDEPGKLQGQEGRVQMTTMKESSTKFVKIQCTGCKNEQIMFGKPSSTVKCLICNKELAEPTGGKADVKCTVLEVLD